MSSEVIGSLITGVDAGGSFTSPYTFCVASALNAPKVVPAKLFTSCSIIYVSVQLLRETWPRLAAFCSIKSPELHSVISKTPSLSSSKSRILETPSPSVSVQVLKDASNA